MSIRTILRLQSGERPVQMRAEVGPLGFPERIRALRAAALEQLAGELNAELTRVVCDGCGTVADIDASDPQLPVGWVAQRDGEFCQACR